MFFNLFSSHSILVSVGNNREEDKAAYGGTYLYSHLSRDWNKRIAESLQPALSTQQDPLQNPKKENKMVLLAAQASGFNLVILDWFPLVTRRVARPCGGVCGLSCHLPYLTPA